VAATLVKDPAFYSQWPYAQPSDILPFIKSQAREGDAMAVLAAMQTFGDYYPTYFLHEEKAKILARLVKEAKPTRAVELGTFLGYSAIWTAMSLPLQGTLTCVEFEPKHAAVARELVRYAGFGEVVEILEGEGAQRIPDLKERMAPGEVASFVFFDHCKPCYLPDLQAMEDAGLIGTGTTVVADNVLYPGAPDFLEWVDTSMGRYKTDLIPADFEYDQVWKKDWVRPRDALSHSVYVADVS